MKHQDTPTSPLKWYKKLNSVILCGNYKRIVQFIQEIELTINAHEEDNKGQEENL